MRQIVLLLFALVVGCSGGPSRIEAPDWRPTRFADAVIEKLDTSGDGRVDASELQEAPGLAAGAKFIDTDGDGTLTHEELKERFRLYRDMRVGITPKELVLIYKKRPVRGAQVELIPEFFLTDIIPPARDQTMGDGTFMPQAEGAEVSGMKVGYYRVVVNAPQSKVPAEYSSADTTTLGVEVSPVSDDPSTYSTVPVVIPEK